MSDFTSGFWSLYVAVITAASVIFCAVFLKSQSRPRAKGEKLATTHAWDEDLQEWNNPCRAGGSTGSTARSSSGCVYLLLYPGLGSFPGLLNWSSTKQYEDERARPMRSMDRSSRSTRR